ncbi:hypothetical protein BpHYR1_036477 [Brachionus plicatilis]|uniref:Uncharacterized protein n=1 Tax=Brachionus plicatilis TaxID=10195 RepID=A0A3M7P2J2_BRAPC|nr:hypothetical protein BpHYR1_036477 [Brachionus plicatilis]
MGTKEVNLFDSIKTGDVSQAVKLLAKNSSSIKKTENRIRSFSVDRHFMKKKKIFSSGNSCTLLGLL